MKPFFGLKANLNWDNKEIEKRRQKWKSYNRKN